MNVDDLLLNDSFLRFVKDGEMAEHWSNLAEKDPVLRSQMAQAEAILKGINSHFEQDIPKGLEETIWHRIQPEIRRKPISIWLKISLPIAASLLIFFTYYFKPQSKINYHTLIQNVEKSDIREYYNQTKEPLVVNLPDHSSIILYTGSRLSYSENNYNNEKREVYFSGEGFFEVTKNPQKPFFVYSNELVTKVLGTSFTIKSHDNSNDIEVIVKSGKVEVTTLKDPKIKQIITSKTLSENHLVANQKIQLDRTTLKLSPIVLPERKEIIHPVQQMNFIFDETPLKSILSDLELAYHIKIYYDKEKYKDVKLTAHLSDEPLYEKIQMICKAIEAECFIAPNQIEIK
jgi:transmembrane sensor